MTPNAQWDPKQRIRFILWILAVLIASSGLKWAMQHPGTPYGGLLQVACYAFMFDVFFFRLKVLGRWKNEREALSALHSLISKRAW